MVRIIETTINMKDHQARVVAYDSWEKYCQLYDNYDGNATDILDGTLIGCVLPKDAKITGLEYDNFHLQCFIQHWDGTWHKKFAFLIFDNQTTLLEDIN